MTLTRIREVVLKEDHNNEPGRHEWVMFGDTIWGAADGTARGSSTLWLKAKCNHIDCPAAALVHAFVADRIIRSAIQQSLA